MFPPRLGNAECYIITAYLWDFLGHGTPLLLGLEPSSYLVGPLGSCPLSPLGLVCGAPNDVRREVRKMIGVVGKGGGLLIALAHFVEPDVPWENIVALSEAVEESGYYK
jgi:hypothetical protein